MVLQPSAEPTFFGRMTRCFSDSSSRWISATLRQCWYEPMVSSSHRLPLLEDRTYEQQSIDGIAMTCIHTSIRAVKRPHGFRSIPPEIRTSPPTAWGRNGFQQQGIHSAYMQPTVSDVLIAMPNCLMAKTPQVRVQDARGYKVCPRHSSKFCSIYTPNAGTASQWSLCLGGCLAITSIQNA